MSISRLAAGLLVACPLLTGPLAAYAQSPAEEAAAVQGQLREWTARLLGPNLDPGERAVRVTADVNAERVELPLAGPLGESGWTVTGAPLVAMARPLEEGRWSVESLHLPSPLQISGPATEGMNWSQRIGEQRISGVFDPTLHGGSAFEGELRDFETTSSTTRDGHTSGQTTHVDRVQVRFGWEPTGEGRVRVFSDSNRENQRVAGTTAEGTPLSASLGRLHEAIQVEGVSFDRLGDVIRGTSGLLTDAPAEAPASGQRPGPKLSPAQRDHARGLTEALPDLMARFEQTAEADNLAVEFGGVSATAGRVEARLRGDATDGLATVSMRIAAQDIDTPAVQGAMRAFLPHRLVLTPRLAGVPARDFATLVRRALEAGDDSAVRQDAPELLRVGPLSVGLEEVRFDVGPAEISAQGELRVPSPREASGTMRVAATGFDALLKQAQDVPELQGAVPVLMMLKGLGEAQGGETVWNVAYADGRTTVNGTDLSTLMPSAGNGQDQPPPGRPQRSRPVRPRQ